MSSLEAHAIVAFLASGSTRPLGFGASIDTRVLLFTAGISLFTGIIFGLAPAMRGTRVNLTPALKEGAGSSLGMGSTGSKWFNIGNSVVIGQVALTMVVLVGAELLVRTLQNLRNIDPGFDAHNILTFGIDPSLIGYKGTRVDALNRNLQLRLSAIPGVASVTYSRDPLLTGSLDQVSLPLMGAPDKPAVQSDILDVGPGFFATMKNPVLEGRDFSQADFITPLTPAVSSPASSAPATTALPQSGPRPAIVNQAFVRRYLSGTSPLGRRLGDSDAAPTGLGYVVIGVVGDAKYDTLRRKINPTVYIPAAGNGAFFELRTKVNPASIIPAVRSIVDQVDSKLPIFNVMTESQNIDLLLFQERLIARLSSFFGMLALLLACVGLYGLLSYEVTRRTREIGIRMALGAVQRNVLGMVVGQGIALAVAGVVVGVASAIGLTRYLNSVLYNVHPGDPVTIAAVATILLIVALVACYMPARRATHVDPMVALRNE